MDQRRPLVKVNSPIAKKGQQQTSNQDQDQQPREQGKRLTLNAKSQSKPVSKMPDSRANSSTRAVIVNDKTFASGIFKEVWKGIYTDGPRKGEFCAVKEFKTGSVFEEHYFQEELSIVERTQRIIDDFAAAKVIENGRIFLNTPEIWIFDDTKEKCLTEPMIQNFEKFNSNTGWAPVTGTA